MKVFISWSGPKSREVAIALREWLPSVINSVEPFVSSKDIDPGTRWQMEVAEQLQSTAYGIVCVTRENQAASWLNFEAGALAKVVDSARVVPLAIDLTPSDIKVPLGQFQAQPATEAGLHEIVTSLNAACSTALSDELIEKAFQKWWPDLSQELEDIEAKSRPKAVQAPQRSERELIEEVLSTVRSLAQDRSTPTTDTELGVPKNHPFVAELRELIRDDEKPGKVLFANKSRRLGVVYPRDEEMDDKLRDQILRAAEPYDIDVVFVAGPARKKTKKAAQKAE